MRPKLTGLSGAASVIFYSILKKTTQRLVCTTLGNSVNGVLVGTHTTLAVDVNHQNMLEHQVAHMDFIVRESHLAIIKGGLGSCTMCHIMSFASMKIYQEEGGSENIDIHEQENSKKKILRPRNQRVNDFFSVFGLKWWELTELFYMTSPKLFGGQNNYRHQSGELIERKIILSQIQQFIVKKYFKK